MAKALGCTEAAAFMHSHIDTHTNTYICGRYRQVTPASSAVQLAVQHFFANIAAAAATRMQIRTRIGLIASNNNASTRKAINFQHQKSVRQRTRVRKTVETHSEVIESVHKHIERGWKTE